MECPICFDTIKNSCFGSCYHHFCFKCLTRWCVSHNTCPVCKTYINQILCDKEFDLINNQLINKNSGYDSSTIYVENYTDSSGCGVGSGVGSGGGGGSGGVEHIVPSVSLGSNLFSITICFDDNIDKQIRLTLKNNSGPGVYVYKISNDCRAYHYGMRKNDVILFVNNLPCYNHKQTIQVFDNCQLSSSNIICKILRR